MCVLEGGNSSGRAAPANCFQAGVIEPAPPGLGHCYEPALSAGPAGSPRSALRYLVGAEAPCSSWQDCTQRAICSITHHALQSETE